MVFRQNQLVVGKIDDLPIMGWIKRLSDRPGEVCLLCVTPEGYEFEFDIDSLEVVNGRETNLSREVNSSRGNDSTEHVGA